MTAFRIFLSRLIGWLGGKKRDADLRAEIDAHIAEAAEEFERQGVPADKARRLAFAQFGGVTQTVEAHRDRRRFRPFGVDVALRAENGQDGTRDGRRPPRSIAKHGAADQRRTDHGDVQITYK